MAIPTDIKERTAADLSAAANDFLSRMAKLGLTASGFLPGLARGMIKAGALRKEDFNVDSPAPDQRASLKALLGKIRIDWSLYPTDESMYNQSKAISRSFEVPQNSNNGVTKTAPR